MNWVALSGPPRLYRGGWSFDTLKVGDKVTVTDLQSKGGKKFMGASKVVGPNGILGGEGELFEWACRFGKNAWRKECEGQ
jgi:hypothetical protein